MKKTLLSLGLLLTSVVFLPANAQLRYFEGKDYKELKEVVPLKQPGQQEIVEVFSYTCPHCHNLEPFIMKWVTEKKPENVGFYKVHATGGSWDFPARVYNVAQKLNLGIEFDMMYFDEIMNKRNRRLAGDKDTAIEFIAKAAKVDTSEVEKSWNSLHVNSALKNTDAYLKKLGLGSVPTVIVNGQYVVQLTEYQRFLSVIDFLLETKKVTPVETAATAKVSPVAAKADAETTTAPKKPAEEIKKAVTN